MLTDLNFLNVGQVFPPHCERERLNKYAQNKQLFDGKHDEVYKQQFKRVARVIGNFDDVINYPVIINFHQLISKKIADLLFQETPQVKCGDENSNEENTVSQLIKNNELWNKCYECAIDVSRYGDGILQVYTDLNQKGAIGVVQPEFWFPVVDIDNIKSYKYHVKAYKYNIGDNSYLRCQIHEKGRFTDRIYKLSKSMTDYTIESLVEENVYKTGLDDFAIVHISNVATSDRITGLDDYTNIDSLMAELEVTVSNIAKILDKHADPSLQGSASALQYDSYTGEYRLKLGNYFVRNDESDPKVEYLTWDAQLSASFKHLENIINFIAIISEMGSLIFTTAGDKVANAPSGTALKKMYVSALSKVSRIRTKFDSGIKKALTLCSQLGGENIFNLSGQDISITWQDGLPSDDKELADVIASRTANKATMSIKRALMQFDGLSESQADEEVALIQEEEASINPITSLNAPFADIEEDNKDEEGNGG